MSNRKEGDECPYCKNGVLTSKLDELPQSGCTYLPTLSWECNVCEYAEYEPQRDTKWMKKVFKPQPDYKPAAYATVEVPCQRQLNSTAS